MSYKHKLVVFISGQGSNLNAIISACNNNEINAEVVAVITNNPEAYGLTYAKNNSINSFIINHKDFKHRVEFDKKVISVLNKINYDLICFAGYMRLVSQFFLNNVKTPVINIHPSLLPKYKGSQAILDAYNAGEAVFGCSVHYVIYDMDAGEIILQKQLKKLPDDDFHSLKNRIHKIEHLAYIEALKTLTLKKI
jgi:phosphoribosylglycinamide formyltransferase-1